MVPRVLSTRWIATRRKPGAAERSRRLDVASALELLRAGRCAICEFVNEREEKFFFWFALEHYLDFGTIDRVDAALGFCPVHCRFLIRRGVFPGTLTHIYLHVTRAAIAYLEKRGDRAVCLGCENEDWASRHAWDSILRTLSENQVRSAFRQAGGFCAVHFLAALEKGWGCEFAELAEVVDERLSPAETRRRALDLFTGVDPDAPFRAQLLARLPEDPLETPKSANLPVLSRLSEDLSADSCPTCLAGARSEHAYLRWIGKERVRNPDGLSREVPGTCREHLATLAEMDGGSATWVASAKADNWRNSLRLFRKRLREESRAWMPGWLRSYRVALRMFQRAEENVAESARRQVAGRRPSPRDVRGFIHQFPSCGVCNARETAEGRTSALLIASVGDRATRSTYERSHGLCLRHLLKIPDDHLPLFSGVWTMRMGVVRWELEEASRKSSWTARYELRGSESSSWARAMAQIDGRVFLGGEAMTSAREAGSP